MKKNNKGFTLIELLAVIGILAIVAAIVVTSAYSLVKSNKEEQYDVLISEISQSIKLYLNDNYENYVVGKDYSTLAVKFLADNSCDKTFIQLKDLVDKNYIKESSLVDPRDSNKIDLNKYAEVYYDEQTLSVSKEFVNEPTFSCTGVQRNNVNKYYSVTSDNNYVVVNNQIFRIIRINKDGSIRLLMNGDIGNSVFGKDNNYESSYVQASIAYWYIYDVVKSAKELIRESSVSLISEVEYNSLSNNLKSSDEFWILKDGTTGITNQNDTIDYLSTSAKIKPMIELKPGIIYVSGTGSINDPYLIR